MASWIVHFQIAEKLLDLVDEKYWEQFIVGNIGPDCGRKKEGSDDFDPSSSITHWMAGKDKNSLRSDDFFNTYLLHPSSDKMYFYLGYYVHLLTDKLWSSQIYMPLAEQYKELIDRDPSFVMRIKKDWYDLDFLYLKEHPDFKAFAIFASIEQFDNVYLDYYPADAFTRQCREITAYYNQRPDDLDHETVYLTMARRQRFTEDAAATIRRDLNERFGWQKR